jgi:type I restriction enzyme M protein
MKDSLANPVDGTEEYNEVQPNGKTEKKHSGYDVVITNMPYSQRTKHGDLYDLPSNNGDSICVQHCMKAINSTSENGRMALVVPEGFLFRRDLSKTRELLLKNYNLQSVISLPQGVFLPYTGVKTNIIYATKVNQKLTSAQKRKDFWYFDVKSDGYTLDNHRRKLDKGSDLDKYQEYRKLDNDQRQEMLDVGFEIVPLNKVKENAYILVGSRYRQTAIVHNNKYPIVTLGDICEFKYGKALKQEDRVNGSYPVFGSNGIVGYHNNFIASAPFIVIGRKGTAGSVVYSDVNGYPIDTTFYVDTVKKPINMKYLSFAMKHFCFNNISTQTGVPGLSRDDAYNEKIPLPPFEIQQQIVDELDGYQRIIDGANVVVRSYRPFIPGSVIGELRALKDIAIFRPSKDEVKTLTADTLVSFVPMADLNTHNIVFTAKEERTIGEVLSGFTYFRDNDVLLAKITPCFENGKAGIARNLKNGIGFGSTEFIVIRANTDIVYPEWIYYHIKSVDFIERGKRSMTGTAGQQRVDINFVKDYSIIVPPLETQSQILDSIASEQELVDSSKKLIDVFAQKMQDRINEIWGE